MTVKTGKSDIVRDDERKISSLRWLVIYCLKRAYHVFEINYFRELLFDKKVS